MSNKPPASRRMALFTAIAALGCADLIGVNSLEDNPAKDRGVSGDSGLGVGGSGSDAGSGSGGTIHSQNNLPSGGTSGVGGTSDGSAGSGGTGGDNLAATAGRAGADIGAAGQGGNSGSGHAGTGGGGGRGCSLNDDFKSSAYTNRCWTLFNAGRLRTPYTQDESAGTISFVPVMSTSWFESGRGVLLYQQAEGNFRVDVTARVDSVTDEAAAPVVSYAGGGLLVANTDVAPGQLGTYYAIKVGTFFPTNTGVKAEVTVNNDTEKDEDAFPRSARLRVCRVGSRLWTGYLLANNQWREHRYVSPSEAVGQNGYALGGTSPNLNSRVIIGLASDNWDQNREGARVQFSNVAFTAVDNFEQCDD